MESNDTTRKPNKRPEAQTIIESTIRDTAADFRTWQQATNEQKQGRYFSTPVDFPQPCTCDALEGVEHTVGCLKVMQQHNMREINVGFVKKRIPNSTIDRHRRIEDEAEIYRRSARAQQPPTGGQRGLMEARKRTAEEFQERLDLIGGNIHAAAGSSISSSRKKSRQGPAISIPEISIPGRTVVPLPAIRLPDFSTAAVVVNSDSALPFEPKGSSPVKRTRSRQPRQQEPLLLEGSDFDVESRIEIEHEVNTHIEDVISQTPAIRVALEDDIAAIEQHVLGANRGVSIDNVMQRSTAALAARRRKCYEITKWRRDILEATAQEGSAERKGPTIEELEEELRAYQSDESESGQLPFVLEEYDNIQSQPDAPSTSDSLSDHSEWEDIDFEYTEILNNPIESRLLISLSLLEIRTRGGLSLAGLDDITSLFKTVRPDLAPYGWRTTEKHLAARTGIYFTEYDVCRNNCFCFLEKLPLKCPLCKEPRYKPGTKKPYITFHYISYIHRLRLQYANPERSRQLQEYRTKLCEEENANDLKDFWNGKLYHELRTFGLFNDPRDIGLVFSTDGFQVFKIRVSKTCWPLIVVNLSLPPQVRFRVDEIMLLGIIPGPRDPADINTFLAPFIIELQKLQRGVRDVWDGYRKEYFTLRAHLCLITGDTKAREKLLASTGCNSSSYCSYCKIRAVRGEIYNTKYGYCPFKPPTVRPDPKQTNLPQAKRIKVACAYEKDYQIYDPWNLPRKTHREYIDVMNVLVENMNHKWAAQYGVRGLSVFSLLWSVSFPRSFPMDSMHQWYNFFKYLYKWFRGKFKAAEDLPTTKDDAPEAPPDKRNNTGDRSGGHKEADQGNSQREDERHDSVLKQFFHNGSDAASDDYTTSESSEEDNSSDDDYNAKHATRTSKGKALANLGSSRQRGGQSSARGTRGGRGRGRGGRGNRGNSQAATATRQHRGSSSKKADIANNRSRPTRQKKFIQTSDEFCISEKVWERIGHEMDLTAQKGLIPSSFGVQIRSIFDHHHHWKCEEWLNWGLRYSEIYLYEELKEPFYSELVNCNDTIRLSLEKELSLDEVEQIRAGFIRFLEHYEQEFYQMDESRLDAWKPTFHNPVHTADNIEDCGPCYVYASWSTEGICGILGRGCKSKRDIYINIANNILRNERLNHLRYTLNIAEFREAGNTDAKGARKEEQTTVQQPATESSRLAMLRELQKTVGGAGAQALEAEIHQLEERDRLQQEAIRSRIHNATADIVEEELRNEEDGDLIERRQLYAWYYNYITKKANRGMFLMAEGNIKATKRSQIFDQRHNDDANSTPNDGAIRDGNKEEMWIIDLEGKPVVAEVTSRIQKLVHQCDSDIWAALNAKFQRVSEDEVDPVGFSLLKYPSAVYWSSNNNGSDPNLTVASAALPRVDRTRNASFVLFKAFDNDTTFNLGEVVYYFTICPTHLVSTNHHQQLDIPEHHKFALVRIVKTEPLDKTRMVVVSKAPGATKDIVVRADNIEEIVGFVARKGRLVLVRKDGSPF